MTAVELIALWSDRDRRYGMRKYLGRTVRVSPEEESAIIAFRRLEIDRLIADSWERTRALVSLANWSAPLAV